MASLDESLSHGCGGPYVAFQRIDRDRNDFITADELIQFLGDNRIYDVSVEEGRHLVAYFDSDDDGRLSYSE